MKESKQLEKHSGGGRAEQLQFLRFLAFMNIYIAHAEVWNFFGYPASHSAAFAVSFFFVLSGLVTGYSGYGKEIRLGLKETGRYMWKKLCKVYPLYFLTMVLPLLYSDIPELIAAEEFAAIAVQLKQLAKNLLMLQSWFPEGYFSFNGVGWFLSSLMFLYLFNLPALFLLNKAEGSARRYLIYAGAFCGIFVGTVAYCYLTQSYDMDFWQYIFPPARAGEYFCGMILGFAVRGMKDRIPAKRWSRMLFTLLEAAAIVFWCISLRRPGNYWMNRIVSWLIPNLFLAGVFAFGMGWVSKLFRWKPLVRLGDISFECFLIHNLVIVRYVLTNSVSNPTRLYCIAAFFYCLLFTIIAALIVHKKPARQ